MDVAVVVVVVIVVVVAVFVVVVGVLAIVVYYKGYRLLKTVGSDIISPKPKLP